MAEPIRTCLGCRKHFPKRTLLRFVVRDGEVEVDPTGKRPGRGGYVCRQSECIEHAIQTKRLQYPLRCTLDGTTIERLKTDLKRAVQELA